MYHLNILLTNKKDFIIYSLARSPAPSFFQWMSDKQDILLLWPWLTHTYIHIFFNLRMCML